MTSKRKSLCINEKVSLIRAIEKGEKKSDVAKRFGFSPSTVSTIWKNKEKFLQAEKNGKTSKKLKKPKFEDLDQAMLSWFCKQRQNNMPVSGPIMKAKAEKLAKKLSITDFKASEGWLGKFKQRHHIIYEAVNKINLRRIEKNALKSRRIANKLPTLTNQISDELDVDAFEKCKLSLKTPTSTDVVNNNSFTLSSDHEDRSNENNDDIERNTSTNIEPEFVRCMDNYTEDDLETHKVKLEELQLRQKLMEEQNKKRKEMLAKALADRTKQTEEEVQKLEKIKKELQVLDGQFSQDVAVLRKKIDQACISYSEAEKNYLKVEKEFLQAKIYLQKEKEKKELLTEHLCALITHNETRKAQKLETLMLELASDKNKVIASNMIDSVASVENSTLDVTPIDEKPIIIDGVDQKTGKMVEMFDEN